MYDEFFAWHALEWQIADAVARLPRQVAVPFEAKAVCILQNHIVFCALDYFYEWMQNQRKFLFGGAAPNMINNDIANPLNLSIAGMRRVFSGIDRFSLL